AGRDWVVVPELGALAEHHADAANVAHALAHRVHAQCAHRAAIGRENPRQQLDRGALAGAVWPRVGDDLATADAQIHVAQCLDLTDRRAHHIAQRLAQSLRALLLAEGLMDAHQLNHGVPIRYSVAIRYVHSVSSLSERSRSPAFPATAP